MLSGYVVIRGWMTKAEVACLPAYAEQVAALKPGSSAPGEPRLAGVLCPLLDALLAAGPGSLCDLACV
jgi:hypothetical protein